VQRASYLASIAASSAAGSEARRGHADDLDDTSQQKRYN
jgi:hypothetical protein